jgi:hypothetical protein
LNAVIKAYFSGENILPAKKVARPKNKAVVTNLTLDTGLIECGFNCGNRFREFLGINFQHKKMKREYIK